MSNDYLHCLQGPNDETWQQALERFASFCLSLHEFVEDGDAYEVLFDGQRLTMSLDELLTGLINKSMISLLARNEVPGGEPGQELS